MYSELEDLRTLQHLLKYRSRSVEHKFRERFDHFKIWNDSEFLKRFRLSKNSAHMVLQKIESKLCHRVERYVCKLVNVFQFVLTNICFLEIQTLQQVNNCYLLYDFTHLVASK